MSVLLLLYTGTQCDLSEHKEVLTKLYGEDPLIVLRYVPIITLCLFCTTITRKKSVMFEVCVVGGLELAVDELPPLARGVLRQSLAWWLD